MKSAAISAVLKHPEGALTSVTNGRHDWQSDIPESLGSHDQAPDPHDLYDSSLAACTVLTIHLYLKRKDWRVDSISCTVHRVSEEKDSQGKVFYRLRREIGLAGELDDTQRARLLEIANKCPIHRLMEGRTEVESFLSARQ